jgi:cAMP phosphodiesterase
MEQKLQKFKQIITQIKQDYNVNENEHAVINETIRKIQSGENVTHLSFSVEGEGDLILYF